MNALPPGTVLQLMYLHERLQRMRPGRFIEVGPGQGEVTRLLLDLGWSGESLDLEPLTIAALQERFAPEIAAGRYRAAGLGQSLPHHGFIERLVERIRQFCDH